MATFTDVFERKEVKYRLSATQREAMLRALDGRLAPDAYGLTRVMSLYLDSPDRLLIERSLDKPRYKEKLRVRSYGVPTDASRVFVEIKKKYKGIVYKRRVGCSYAAARVYLGGMSYEGACKRYPLPDPVMAAESVAPHSLQIAREIDWCRASYDDLRASMAIGCDRVAYVSVTAGCEGAAAGASADSLRITFDTALTYRDLFQRDARNLPLLNEGEAIMEIKSAGPFPLWLVRALDECQAYPSSFSKYGAAYRACATSAAQRSAPAAAHAAHAAAEQKAERLAAVVHGSRSPRFCIPFATPIKKGGRCA